MIFENPIFWVGPLVGAILGGLGVWLWLRGQLAVAQNQFQSQAQSLDQTSKALQETVKKLESVSSEKQDLLLHLARRDTEIEERDQAHQEKLAALSKINSELDQRFQSMAAEALKSNNSSFLEMAQVALAKHQQAAAADLAQRQQAIDQLLQPMAETLRQMEKSQVEAAGRLDAELKNMVIGQNQVQKEAAKLVNALRAAPKTRGRWGEQSLKRVMEMAGMSEHVDFDLEVSHERDERKLRPDAIVHLPGGRSIVVDSKVAATAYLEALEEPDEILREAHFKRHAQQLRTHMNQLASKDYWDGLTNTPDFVAMFIANENFYTAALEQDPNLFEDAFAKKVLMVTPTTLLAMVKAVAYGWRQEKVGQNAKMIADMGAELYKRLQTMGGNIASLQKHIDGMVKSYNAFAGSLDTRVLPYARRFAQLDVVKVEELPVTPQVDTITRDLSHNADLLPLTSSNTSHSGNVD